jgi:hypothetical protein
MLAQSVQRLDYRLDDRGSRIRFPAGAGKFSPHHRAQNSSGAHPASYPMCTRCSFPGVKRPGRESDHSPSSSAEVKECVELYLHSYNTPSCRGAQLKKKSTGTTLPYVCTLGHRFTVFVTSTENIMFIILCFIAPALCIFLLSCVRKRSVC